MGPGEIILAAALAVAVVLLLSAHASHGKEKAVKKLRHRSLGREIASLEKSKINKALAVAFAAVAGLLLMPIVAASATGEITALEGRGGVLALLAFFTATYAIILIHAVLGRE